MKLVFASTLAAIILPLLISGFRSPLDKTMLLPYGRQMRAILSGRLSPLEEQVDDLQWWHSISRNNTVDCECGKFSTSENVENWENEGIKSISEYPWSVSLVAPNGVYAFCGGSLVNDRYVLTSASCVDGSNSDGVEVLIGTWPKAHYTTFDPDQLNSTSLIRKKVHRVILHPKYIDQNLDYNIALLRLKGPVPTFGNEGGISPVCLPQQGASFDGWNASSLLWRFHEEDGFILPIKRSEVTSEVLTKSECKSFSYSKEWENMPDTLMCTNMEMPSEEDHPYYSTYDCPGDAGGPLLVTSGHQKIQIGIDSWTACYGRPKGVSVYTRINEFLPWIKLHISEDGRLCSK